MIYPSMYLLTYIDEQFVNFAQLADMFPTLKVHGSRNAKKAGFFWHFHLMFLLVPKTTSVSVGRSSPSTNEVPLRCTCLGERPLEPAPQLLELEGWPKPLEETKIQTYLQL